MTIDEAIKWYKDKEAEYRDLAKEEHKNFVMIAEVYQQFAEWLTELKDLREENKFLISEFDRLIKEKGEQIAEYKRLLKVAVEDFANMNYHIYKCDGMCDTCPIHGNRDECDKWRYADEALALIGDEQNGI